MAASSGEEAAGYLGLDKVKEGCDAGMQIRWCFIAKHLEWICFVPAGADTAGTMKR